MIAFHRHLLQPAKPTTRPASAPEALRTASIELMKNPAYRHPFYWAGFIVIGAQ